MQRRQGHGSFERGSHVREYWLANCVGFAVAGSPTRTRVKAVVVDPADGRAHHVLVGGWTRGRTRVLPAETIEAVDPFERVLYPQSSSRVRTSARALLGTAGRFRPWLRPRLQTLAVTVRTRCREIGAWLRPRARATAVWIRVRWAEAVAWLRPRLRTAVASTRARSRDGVEWLRPRAVRAGRATAGRVRAAWSVVAARLNDAAARLNDAARTRRARGR